MSELLLQKFLAALGSADSQPLTQNPAYKPHPKTSLLHSHIQRQFHNLRCNMKGVSETFYNIFPFFCSTFVSNPAYFKIFYTDKAG
jgi:hypothetical protein